MKTTLIGDNENKTETLDSVPNFQRGDKTKYVLDATKERLEKAPKLEGKNYERLYARETAEPIFIYWEETWVVEP
jgi:hypothetical protein